MPTSDSEARTISEIIDEYVDEDAARELVSKLHVQVGQGTDNDSLRVSLEMLNGIYSAKPVERNYLKKTLLYALVLFHMSVVVTNIVSFFILPFCYPLYLWVPVNSFILAVSFTRELCPLTRLENHLRRSLGMKPIGGFIGQYVYRPVKRFMVRRGDAM